MMCILIYSKSQFVLLTFQVLHSHIWLMATVLDNTALKYNDLVSSANDYKGKSRGQGKPLD